MSINWEVPLQSRNGYAATVVYSFYNGVNTMWVVSLNRGPTCTVPGAKNVELIKIYDHWGRDCTKMERGPGGKASEYDLMEVPPPDIVTYIVCAEHFNHKGEVVATAGPDLRKYLGAGSSVNYYGQIKAVIDGRTGKLKSVEIV